MAASSYQRLQNSTNARNTVKFAKVRSIVGNWPFPISISNFRFQLEIGKGVCPISVSNWKFEIIVRFQLSCPIGTWHLEIISVSNVWFRLELGNWKWFSVSNWKLETPLFGVEAPPSMLFLISGAWNTLASPVLGPLVRICRGWVSLLWHWVYVCSFAECGHLECSLSILRHLLDSKRFHPSREKRQNMNMFFRGRGPAHHFATCWERMPSLEEMLE